MHEMCFDVGFLHLCRTYLLAGGSYTFQVQALGTAGKY